MQGAWGNTQACLTTGTLPPTRGTSVTAWDAGHGGAQDGSTGQPTGRQRPSHEHPGLLVSLPEGEGRGVWTWKKKS